MKEISSPSIVMITVLKERFFRHMHRHPNVSWSMVEELLAKHPQKLKSLEQMEATGGEPDVVECTLYPNNICFFDCSTESPKGRRSGCYDQKALDERKEHKPAFNIVTMAADMGVELLSEELYRSLQQFGPFDMKTSSWILTPPEIRALGGALFCDYRYGKVFVYHNGAQSYYASRGFRTLLRL